MYAYVRVRAREGLGIKKRNIIKMTTLLSSHFYRYNANLVI